MDVFYRPHSQRSRRFYSHDSPSHSYSIFTPHSSPSYPFATINQSILRARQLWSLLHPKQPPWSNAFYNAFFNTLWLILNDITIGCAFSSFLDDNDINGLLAHRLEPWLIHSIHHLLHWLDSWPAGLKLNTGLSRFYTHSLALLSHAFSHLVRFVVDHFQLALMAASLFSRLGASFVLALLIDLVSLLTAHITLSYALSRIVYRRTILAARSLFNLFRGNVVEYLIKYPH